MPAPGSERFYFPEASSLTCHRPRGHGLRSVHKGRTPVTSVPATGHQPGPTCLGALLPHDRSCSAQVVMALTPALWLGLPAGSLTFVGPFTHMYSRAPHPLLEVTCVSHTPRDRAAACPPPLHPGPRWGHATGGLLTVVGSSTWLF